VVRISAGLRVIPNENSGGSFLSHKAVVSSRLLNYLTSSPNSYLLFTRDCLSSHSVIQNLSSLNRLNQSTEYSGSYSSIKEISAALRPTFVSLCLYLVFCRTMFLLATSKSLQTA
jgi:hypothetical protein